MRSVAAKSNLNHHDVQRPDFGKAKEASSFLKKRSKKLLIALRGGRLATIVPSWIMAM
jgi:hypothetical protein